MNKAVFLDRDGVINVDISDYTYRIEDFKIIEGVFESLKFFLQKDYLLIVITNQGGIAKNLYGHQEVKTLHHHLENVLSKENIHLTDIYYCPHHTVSGNCICRKPDSLMIEKAMARYRIDRNLSYFIGDNERDVEAAKKAGVCPVKIESNSSILNILHLIR